MGKTILKYLKYTKTELNNYVKDEKSCILCVNCPQHINFPPWGLAKFREILTSITQKKIGRYETQLNGIVLDVRNIKVLSNLFPIYNDNPFLHINILADFYIFKPIVGAVITGIVKHIAPSHISVTVYRVFNVSIRLKQLQKGLRINTDISVKITNFDLEDSMPYIEGILDRQMEDIDFDVVECENTSDSGIISTEERRNKKQIQKQIKTHKSSSESDSDSEDDLQNTFLADQTTIKNEPDSDNANSSSSEMEQDNKSLVVLKKERNLSELDNYNQRAVGNIKQENVTTSESNSDIKSTRKPKNKSSLNNINLKLKQSNSDSEPYNFKLSTKKVKKEKTANTKSDTESSDSEPDHFQLRTVNSPKTKKVKKEKSSKDKSNPLVENEVNTKSYIESSETETKPNIASNRNKSQQGTSHSESDSFQLSIDNSPKFKKVKLEKSSKGNTNTMLENVVNTKSDTESTVTATKPNTASSTNKRQQAASDSEPENLQLKNVNSPKTKKVKKENSSKDNSNLLFENLVAAQSDSTLPDTKERKVRKRKKSINKIDSLIQMVMKKKFKTEETSPNDESTDEEPPKKKSRKSKKEKLTSVDSLIKKIMLEKENSSLSLHLDESPKKKPRKSKNETKTSIDSLIMKMIAEKEKPSVTPKRNLNESMLASPTTKSENTSKNNTNTSIGNVSDLSFSSPIFSSTMREPKSNGKKRKKISDQTNDIFNKILAKF